MTDKPVLIDKQDIENRIFTIRGIQVMVDKDLADLYLVETKVLNQAVKRNIERFPSSFSFQLTDDEKIELVTNCDRFKNLKHSSTLPYAFTEQGVAMISAILRSKIAIHVSIQIIQAFVGMRKFISENAAIFQRLDRVERKQLEADKKFDKIFDAMQSKDLEHKQGIFFDGQVFDAYTFFADLIRNAKKSIILIDNYVDDTVLTLFAKRQKGVTVTIYSKSINKQLKLDLEKYNSQYPTIEIIEFKDAHDRFMIIDSNELYHIGASLKDLGKKWFAFSKMDKEALNILAKLNKIKILP